MMDVEPSHWLRGVGDRSLNCEDGLRCFDRSFEMGELFPRDGDQHPKDGFDQPFPKNCWLAFSVPYLVGLWRRRKAEEHVGATTSRMVDRLAMLLIEFLPKVKSNYDMTVLRSRLWDVFGRYLIQDVHSRKAEVRRAARRYFEIWCNIARYGAMLHDEENARSDGEEMWKGDDPTTQGTETDDDMTVLVEY
jgi:hypothetical protein